MTTGKPITFTNVTKKFSIFPRHRNGSYSGAESHHDQHANRVDISDLAHQCHQGLNTVAFKRIFAFIVRMQYGINSPEKVMTQAFNEPS